MHLASDYIHPTPHRGFCRIRIYLPGNERDAPVVVCSEVAGNEGQSVTNAAEQLAAEVIRYNELPVPVWIEHYPPETSDGRAETFDLVTFGHHEVREIIRGGGMRLEIGPPTWKRLDRASVEVLIGEKLD